MTVRRAQVSDLQDIAALERTCFSDPWSESSFRNVLEDENSVLLVLTEEDIFRGFCVLLLLGPEAEILNIAVAPEARNRGCGGALLDRALEDAAQNGAEDVFLEVRASNAPAISLYTRRGFVPCGRRKNYYTRPTEDAILMKRGLTLC